MKHHILLAIFLITHLHAADGQRFDLSKRASEIDPRAKEHPEIKFTFTDDKGKPADLQHAVVDTRVPSQGKLVIWLMGHNQGLFERIASYGYHGIQPHYSNGWFAGLTKTQYEDGSGTAIGKVRLEAATGEDFSPLVSIPRPDGMMARSLQLVKWLVKENPDAVSHRRWPWPAVGEGHHERHLARQHHSGPFCHAPEGGPRSHVLRSA